MSAVARPPIRILGLCGFSQNKHVMHQRLGFLRKALKQQVEFDFVDPPFVIEKVDYATGNTKFADFDSETTMDENVTPETTPRAWFRSKDEEVNGKTIKTYIGLDQALADLHKYLIEQETPFDAVFGFSQGACMAALLTALLERPGLHPSFPAHPKLKPLKYCVSVGGFICSDEAYSNFYPIATPTLHIVGVNDTIVTPERSQTLIRVCDDARVEKHDGSHFIPSKASWKNFFVAYLTSFTDEGLQGDVPGPSSQPGGAASTTASANTTRPGTPEVTAGEEKSAL